mmetsp:Transcript_50180/g.117872  ORF Transcript_50180/g.117872 Transcript_50180/m.117872 type:complete len:132 (+) Transcript_50180:304-699(+)
MVAQHSWLLLCRIVVSLLSSTSTAIALLTGVSEGLQRQCRNVAISTGFVCSRIPSVPKAHVDWQKLGRLRASRKGDCCVNRVIKMEASLATLAGQVGAVPWFPARVHKFRDEAAKKQQLQSPHAHHCDGKA